MTTDQKQTLKTLALWAVILSIVGGIYWLVDDAGPVPEVPYSELVDDLRAGRVRSVVIEGQSLEYALRDPEGRGAAFDARRATVAPADPAALSALLASAPGTEVRYQEASAGSWTDLVPLLAAAIVLVALFLAVRALRPTSSGRSFTDSPMELVDASKLSETFDDVVGAHEAKQQLLLMARIFAQPDLGAEVGVKLEHTLLVGDPGVGKTMLARALAKKIEGSFGVLSGSGLVELYVGVGAARVKDTFRKAEMSAPCVLFIDEIDSVGRARGRGGAVTNDEREQTLNELLIQLDGFKPLDKRVIVLAATNRADVLDPALLRPGRFTNRIDVSGPSTEDEIRQLLEVHLRGRTTSVTKQDLTEIAKKAATLSGAEIVAVIDHAARAAILELPAAPPPPKKKSSVFQPRPGAPDEGPSEERPQSPEIRVEHLRAALERVRRDRRA